MKLVNLWGILDGCEKEAKVINRFWNNAQRIKGTENEKLLERFGWNAEWV